MTKQIYKFENWVFVPHENKLLLDGQETLIDNRLSNLLAFLCRHPKTILSRDELIDQVWKGSILTDQVITQAIFELRKILKTNNLHLQGYIITVPKRGYKLDVDVEVMQQAVNQPIDLGQTVTAETEQADLTEASDGSNIAAASPHLLATSNESKPHAKSSLPKPNGFKPSNMLALSGAVIAIIVAVVFFTTPKAIKNLPAAQGDYIALEPRFIHVSIDNHLDNADLQNGIIFKVLEYLKYNINYRVSFNPAEAAKAAKVVSFFVTRENDIDYINLEYFNKISAYQHIDRKYPISEDHLSRSIKVMLDDILDAFNIDIAKSELDIALEELPNDPQALAYSLEAIGALHSSANQFDSVDILQKALVIEPKNHYLLSMDYIYSMVVAYMGKSNLNLDDINTLNLEFEKNIQELMTEPASYKVYEAFALHALSKDLPIEAVQYLNKIPHTHNTIMTFILRAKLAESFGNPASAEEFYYQALHESGTPRIMDVAESLLFYSDLTKMKDKLAMNAIEN